MVCCFARRYRELVDAGVSLLCLHGRTRHQKGQLTGSVSWDAIRQVVEAIGDRVPVLANGGIASLDDVRACLGETGALGVMSSEGLLEYPALFTETSTAETGGKRTGPGRCELAREYVRFSEEFPPDKNGQGGGHKCVRTHLQKFLYADLQDSPEIRDLMNVAVTAQDMCVCAAGGGASEASAAKERSLLSRGSERAREVEGARAKRAQRTGVPSAAAEAGRKEPACGRLRPPPLRSGLSERDPPSTHPPPRARPHADPPPARRYEVISECERQQKSRGTDKGSEQLAWYLRHRCEREGETKLDLPQMEISDDFAECGCSMFDEGGGAGGGGDY
jgi:hypothetical protein